MIIGDLSRLRSLILALLALSATQCIGSAFHNSSSIAGFQTNSGSATDKSNGLIRLWTDPVDLEHRNLFFGIGGPDGAPNSEASYIFLSRHGSPVDESEKFLVKDERGRRWVVKLGPEAGPEIAASRLVWAAGYYVDQDYFVKRAHVSGRGGFDVWNARFERDDDGFKTAGRWSWKSNPLADRREFQGLKVMMALLNNWDLSEANNKIVISSSGTGSETGERIYYVNDLGASLGRTGSWLNKIPLYKDEAVPGSRGEPSVFANERFIDGVNSGEVLFHWRRKFGRDALRGVTVENARWMGNLLGRLSDAQLADAFRAGGFEDQEVRLYVTAIRDRIRQLQNLK